MKAVSIVVLSILVLGLLTFFGWLGFSAYQQSQGPALDSTSEPLFATKTPLSDAHSSTSIPPTAIRPVTATAAMPLAASPTPQETETTQVQHETCGETTAWNILILGFDYADMRGQKGSDLTRVIHADFANKKAVVYAFSRDLWVDTAGLGLVNPTIDATRLGMVFYEGRIRSLQFAEINTVVDGTRTTAKMLSKNFSVGIDHYLSLDLKYIAGMIDAIGGLPINIPTRTTDPWIGMVIEAGQQTLNGAQVVAYGRAIPDSDFGRIKRNDLLMEALRQKLLDPAVMAKIPNLYAQFNKVIATDLSLEQINHLACLLKDVPESEVLQESVKQEWTSAGPQGSLLWNKDNVFARFKELGLVPTTPTAVHWTYEGEEGPTNWGKLSPEYETCSKGQAQSPIDILKPEPKDIDNLIFHYQPSKINILNNGHTVQVNYDTGSYIELNGDRYDLVQFHFHAPSEHSINGRLAEAELHLVHKSAAGNLAVVGILIEAGAENPAFRSTWDNLPAEKGQVQQLSVEVDATGMLPANQETYRYTGSLTTPPCTEGVKWFVMTEAIKMSDTQLAAFTKIFEGNNRPVQPLNGRTLIEDSSP